MKRPGLVLVLTLFCCLSKPLLGADDDALPFDVDQWLRSPDRQDFSWTVRVSKARLTLQQRHLVRLHASIDVNSLEKELRHDFHFLIKVADSDNLWFPGSFHTQVPLTAGLGNLAPLSFDAGLYLRPGRYTVAVIAYDAAVNRGNIRRQEINVSPPKGGLLPDLDRDLPNIEFIPDVPGTALMDEYEWSFASPFFTDSGWRLGGGKEWLPVKNRRCLCIDIIVNTSVDQDTNRYRPPWAFNYRMNASQMLQVSSVLSHLGLRTGSVRVSILDVLRMKTLFYREDAKDFDWQHASEVVEKQDQATIDARLLSLQKQAPAYLFDVYQKIMADAACANTGEPPLKVVIVVSRELWFDEESWVQQFFPQDRASMMFFYFCVTEHEYVRDDILKMLKLTKPRCFFLLDPVYFRKALATLISRLEKL